MSIDPLDRKPVQYASHFRYTLDGPGFLNEGLSSRSTTELQSWPKYGESDERRYARSLKMNQESSRFAKVERKRTPPTAGLNLLQGESTSGCRMSLNRNQEATLQKNSEEISTQSSRSRERAQCLYLCLARSSG